MKNVNISEGVKKLFYSEAISLGVLFLSLITSILYLGLGGYEAVEESGLKVLVMIFGILVLIASIVAFVFYLLGLNQAQKEDETFKKAFYCVIGNIVLTFISFFVGNRIVSGIFSLIENILSILAFYFVITALIELFENKNEDLVNKGKKLLLFYIIVFVAGALLRVISGFLPESAGVIVDALDAIGFLVEILGSILYCMYLYKSSTALLQLPVEEKVSEEQVEF